MKRLAISIVLVIVSFITFLTSAFGWLASYSVIPATINGSVQTGYFGGGKGIKGEPYILSTPRHVYNLAWLQYTGYLNNTLNDDGTIKQAYFQVTDNIDMGGLVIPPIGTREYPFVGNFNGNGKRIYNFHVANYVGGNGGITERPLSVADMGNDASIVGFFGVIGDFDGALKGKIVDDSGKETGEQVNAVYNLYLDNFSVSTLTTESLIGLLAGYVNGGVKNVGIGVDNEGYGATINVGEGTMPLSEATLGTVPESLSRVQTFNALSLFALLGEFDGANVTWENAPTESLGGDAGAEGQGFGGSIDMYDLARRLAYMYTENIVKNVGSSIPSLTEGYPVTFFTIRNNGEITETNRATNRFTYGQGDNRVAYLKKTTIMPLNVDHATMFSGETIHSKDDNFEYKTTTYYANNTTEKINIGNTGYLIGGDPNGIPRVRGDLIAGGQYGGIYRSMGTAEDESATFSRDKLHCLTIRNGTTYVIKDDFNTSASTSVNNEQGMSADTYKNLKLSKYEAVMQGFSTSMQEHPTIIQGLRFFNGHTLESVKETELDATQTVKKTTVVKPAIIGKTTYNNGYQMIDGGINFHLEKDGVITTLAGTYASSSGAHQMFTLYQVARDENGNIIFDEKTFEITSIWVSKSDSSKIEYNKTGLTDYDCVYDSENMKNLEEENALYYFELPVKKGDYFLTSKSGDSGAYLLYLDIGANGAIGDTGGDTQPGEGGPAYTIEGVNFVDKNPFTAEETDSVRTIDDKTEYPVITYRFALPKESTTHSGLHISFARTSARAMTHKLTDTTESQFEILHHTDDTGITFNTPNATANVRYVYKKQEETGAA